MKAPLPANEFDRLAELRSYHVLDTAPEASFERIVRMASRFFTVPMAAISLVDEHRQWLKASCGMPDRETERDYSFCAHAILNSEIFVVRDALKDSRFADNPLVLGPPYIRFYAGAVLKSSDGFALGSLCILDTAPRRFTVEEGHMLIDLGATVVNELSLRRALDDRRVPPANNGSRARFSPATEPRLPQRRDDSEASDFSNLAINTALANHSLYEGIAERERTETANARLDRLDEEKLELIMLASLDGQVTYLNAVGREVLGVGSLAEARRRRILDFVPADRRAFFEQRVFSELFGRGQWESTFALRHFQTGALVPLTWNMSVVRNPETGEPMSIASTLRDSAPPKTGVIARHSAREQAETAHRAKSVFLSRMSHEFRTPLNAILGFGQLLELQTPDGPQKECSSHIVKAGRHLLSLINEVLDISWLESGQIELLREPVRVADAVVEAVNLVQPLAIKRGIIVQVDADLSGSYAVMADPDRFRQVINNLLVNAVKYNRDGGRVQIACRPAGSDRVRVSFEYQGPAMKKEQLERLFVPFERMGTDETGERGTGLGLSLCKQLLEALGGTIGVESDPKSGSTFWFELPSAGPTPVLSVLPAAPVEMERNRDPERLRSEIPDDHPATPGFDSASGDRPITTTDDMVQTACALLVIERDAKASGLTKRLGDCRPDLRILSAPDAMRGLAVAGECHPDLIVLALPLPDMLGWQVLKHLRASKLTRSIFVAVVINDAASETREGLLLAGAKVCLTPPIEIERVLELLPPPCSRLP